MEEPTNAGRLEQMFHAHAGAVRLYARQLVGVDAADDIVAEVYLTAT